MLSLGGGVVVRGVVVDGVEVVESLREDFRWLLSRSPKFELDEGVAVSELIKR